MSDRSNVAPGKIMQKHTPLLEPVSLRSQPLGKPTGEFPITAKVSQIAQNNIKIIFHPEKSKKIKHASKINFHQAMTILAGKADGTMQQLKPGDIDTRDKFIHPWMAGAWFLDVGDPKNPPPPYPPSYYTAHESNKGIYLPGKTRRAAISDDPQIPQEILHELMYHKKENPQGRYIYIQFFYETFAVCEEGNDKPNRQWYEGITWFWKVDSDQAFSPSGWRGRCYVGGQSRVPTQKFIAAVEKYREVSKKPLG